MSDWMDELDPGVADLVRELNRRGWRTTDSGDGVSKFDPDSPKHDPDAIPFPHVAIRLEPDPTLLSSQGLRYVRLTHDIQLDLDEIAPGFLAEMTFSPRGKFAIVFCSKDEP